jgi:hypothetical protein
MTQDDGDDDANDEFEDSGEKVSSDSFFCV